MQTDKLYKHLTCCEVLPVLSPDNLYVILWKVWIMVVSIFFLYEIPVYVCFGFGIYVIKLIFFKVFIERIWYDRSIDRNSSISVNLVFYI